MATKTFKIGEYCKGGVITAEVKNKTVTVIGKDWDFSQGTKRGSNQSNAKEFTRLEVEADNSEARRALLLYLNELTTSYHADKVIEWVESKVELSGGGFFGW